MKFSNKFFFRHFKSLLYKIIINIARENKKTPIPHKRDGVTRGSTLIDFLDEAHSAPLTPAYGLAYSQKLSAVSLKVVRPSFYPTALSLGSIFCKDMATTSPSHY